MIQRRKEISDWLFGRIAKHQDIRIRPLPTVSPDTRSAETVRFLGGIETAPGGIMRFAVVDPGWSSREPAPRIPIAERSHAKLVTQEWADDPLVEVIIDTRIVDETDGRLIVSPDDSDSLPTRIEERERCTW
jgi:hypothetical protein